MGIKCKLEKKWVKHVLARRPWLSCMGGIWQSQTRGSDYNRNLSSVVVHGGVHFNIPCTLPYIRSCTSAHTQPQACTNNVRIGIICNETRMACIRMLPTSNPGYSD
jgi:hypothetical protein